MVVDAEAELLGTLDRAVGEFQQPNGGTMIGRYDLDLFGDNARAPMR